MMKKTLCLLLACLLLLGVTPYAIAASADLTDAYKPAPIRNTQDTEAVPAVFNFTFGGERADPAVYTIDGADYMKLRDLAVMLDGTEKHFSVFWQQELKAIEIFTDAGYTPVGGEMEAAKHGAAASASANGLFVNGKQLAIDAYIIAGNHFFKLSDLAKTFDFAMTYDRETNTYDIDAAMAYAASSGTILYAGAIRAAGQSGEKYMDKGASAITIAFMAGNELVYSEGFSDGVRTVDARTGFNVGSIGKLFTAVSALQLADSGALDLDAPVTDYLPKFRMADARYKDITVRMLLNHSSGIPGTYLDRIFTVEDDPDYLDRMLESLQTATLTSTPGTVSVYCNDGWSLLQLIIEEVTQEPFIDYVLTNIFAPAGMIRSASSAEPVDDALAHVVSGGAALPREIVNALGAGGFTSTAEDLCRFASALFLGELLTADMLAQCVSDQTAPSTVPGGKAHRDFGYGWDYVSMPQFASYGVNVLGKNGGTAQFNSQLNVLPEEGVSVAVSVCGEGSAVSIAHDITVALLKDLGYSEGAYEYPGAQPADMPEDILKYEGYYSGAFLMHAAFDPGQNTLSEEIQIMGTMYPTGDAQYMDDGSFRSDTSRAFFDDSTGKALLISDTNGRYDVSGEKLEPNRDIDTAAFAGETWIPYNLSLSDILAQVLSTDTFEYMPGYITAGFDGVLLPYQLADETSTAFALSHKPDQLELNIESTNGQDTITAAGYLYQRISDASPLSEREAITIDSRGHNIARRVTKSGTLTFESSGEYRVLVYRSTAKWEGVYDSLLQGEAPTSVQEGDILLVVGQPGETILIACNS